jgi:integrase/recombinase XerD
MTTTTPSTALATIQPAFADPERLALAGFLAGYRGLTREAYALDLRQFTTWCRTRSLPLFGVRRAGIESFARELEARGRARATVIRRLCTVAGFYKYAVEEELLDNSPAAHVRRPRLDYESNAVAPDRNELGALLVAAGLGPPLEHALISLLALNGRRGPPGRSTLAIGERTEGRVFLARDGGRLDRHSAGRIVRKTARSAGSPSWSPAYPAARVHYRRAGRRGAAAGCARGRLARGPADDHAVRPGPRQPGPACHLHRRRLPRRRRPIAAKLGNSAAWQPLPPGSCSPARQLQAPAAGWNPMVARAGTAARHPGRSPVSGARSGPSARRGLW